MRKWLVYLLGIVSGIILTIAIAFYINLSNNRGIIGLEMFDDPGDYMDYSQFEIFQVVTDGCALARANGSFGQVVFIIPGETQNFYDSQKIVLNDKQAALRVGTYKYSSQMGDKTVPAIEIIDGVESIDTNTVKNYSEMTLFDKPGDCVSRKNFEIQNILESGDAIALEISETISGHVFTSNLEVLMLVHEGAPFYDNQIVKVPQGKCARQIGIYKYQQYGKIKTIPIVEIR